MPNEPQLDNSAELRQEFRTKSFLRELREARGMTQVQLAGIVGTSPQIISKGEQGKVLQLRTSMLIRIASSLELGVSDIWPLFGSRRKKS